MKDIQFVIVTYQPDTKVLRNLVRTLSGYDIVLVDNGGSSVQKLMGRTGAKAVTYLTANKNVGYGAGANIGIRHARKHEAQWIVVLNQDLVLTKKAVKLFVELLTISPPGVIGPEAGSLDARRWTTILGNDAGDPAYISGSIVAIHTDVVKRIGYFYDRFFLYYEDVDYSVRAKAAGFPLTAVSIDGMVHEESTSLGRGSRQHEYYLARNHQLFIERNAPFPIRFMEALRLPWTYLSHRFSGNKGAQEGISDYVLRHFGRKR